MPLAHFARLLSWQIRTRACYTTRQKFLTRSGALSSAASAGVMMAHG